MKNKINSLKSKCVTCGNGISDFRYKSMLEWDISGDLCGKCYGRKLTEYYIPEERQAAIKNDFLSLEK